MHRREFLRKSVLATGVAMTPALCAASSQTTGSRIHWTRTGELFTAVACDGEPMCPTSDLLTTNGRVAEESTAGGLGPLRISVEHRLHDSGAGMGEDVLEARLNVRNISDRPQRVELGFTTSARPSQRVEEQRVHVPLSAAGLFGDGRFDALGVKHFLKDCNQLVAANDFTAHYLEPMASFPAECETRALLLAPVVDMFDAPRPWRVALFTPSDQPMRFSQSGGQWRAGRQLVVPTGETFTQRCWLMLHQGEATMSFEKMFARIKATRAAGAKAAVYIHAALFDDAALCFSRLGETVQVDASGRRMNFGWTGPDTAGKTWRASLGSAKWAPGWASRMAGWNTPASRGCRPRSKPRCSVTSHPCLPWRSGSRCSMPRANFNDGNWKEMKMKDNMTIAGFERSFVRSRIGTTKEHALALLAVLLLSLAAEAQTASAKAPSAGAAGRKTIVTVSNSTPDRPRKSEGDVIELKDGRLLLVSMEFGGDGNDFAITRLVAHESSDGGLTWGGHRVVADTAPGDVNVYSPNLIRAQDGSILLLFHRHHGKDEAQGPSCTLYAWKSGDEGRSFTRFAEFFARKEHQLCNATVKRLASGRLLLPVSPAVPGDHGPWGKYAATVLFSDDDGRTWSEAANRLTLPKRGAMEPHVEQTGDGRVLMVMRNQLGTLHLSESTDDGLHWSDPKSTGLTSPESCPELTRIPATGDLLMIWNNTFDPAFRSHCGKRSPLTAAVSKDHGRTWQHVRDIETDPNRAFSNPGCRFTRDGRAILNYWTCEYLSDWRMQDVIDLRVAVIDTAWFYGSSTEAP